MRIELEDRTHAIFLVFTLALAAWGPACGDGTVGPKVSAPVEFKEGLRGDAGPQRSRGDDGCFRDFKRDRHEFIWTAQSTINEMIGTGSYSLCVLFRVESYASSSRCDAYTNGSNWYVFARNARCGVYCID